MILRPQRLLPLTLHRPPLLIRRFLRIPLHCIFCRRALILISRNSAAITDGLLYASRVRRVLSFRGPGRFDACLLAAGGLRVPEVAFYAEVDGGGEGAVGCGWVLID